MLTKIQTFNEKYTIKYAKRIFDTKYILRNFKPLILLSVENIIYENYDLLVDLEIYDNDPNNILEYLIYDINGKSQYKAKQLETGLIEFYIIDFDFWYIEPDLLTKRIRKINRIKNNLIEYDYK